MTFNRVAARLSWTDYPKDLVFLDLKGYALECLLRSILNAKG